MRRRRFISILGRAALAPLSALPAYADPSGACGVPLARGDGWPVGSVNDDGLVNRDALCAMADRLASGDTNIHAVLVVRNGKLAFERYFKGADEIPGHIYGRRVETVAFDADTLHDMKSVSKSVASLAVGIAIDRGLIRSVDEPIWSFFPELADLRSPEKDRIRLAHVLSMSMGLKWVEATPATGDYDNDEARMHMAWDPCRYVLGLPVTAAAGQEFFYNTGALTLVSAIIRKATGRPLDEFARETLFEPLGITSTAWDRYRGGYRCRRGIALATARHGQDRPAGSCGRSLERPPDRFQGMDRRLDGREDQGDGRSILRISVVAGPSEAQSREGQLDRRAWSRRAVDPHRPEARSRRRGDRGLLSGLQPASISIAVRRIPGRVARDPASGLSWAASRRQSLSRFRTVTVVESPQLA
nr:serine hydrolase domain-containing protein [Bradyrhizobium genosp. SA-3]